MTWLLILFHIHRWLSPSLDQSVDVSTHVYMIAYVCLHMNAEAWIHTHIHLYIFLVSIHDLEPQSEGSKDSTSFTYTQKSLRRWMKFVHLFCWYLIQVVYYYHLFPPICENLVYHITKWKKRPRILKNHLEQWSINKLN